MNKLIKRMISFQMNCREVILTVSVLLISLEVCDCDRSRYNAKYNQLISTDNQMKIPSEHMPKQTKFFDFNDFDCE